MSALAIVSCVNEKHDIQEPGGRFAFTAGFISEQLPQSKVFLEHNYYKSELYVLWEKDDQVSIFDGVNNGCFISDRAGLSTSLSIDQNADFNEEADNYYALFPYDEDAAFAEENGTMYVSTTLPAEQTARRDAFSAHRAIAACTSADQNLQFRNVTAVFKTKITTDGVSRITFQGKNGEVVAGDIKVSYNDVGYVVVDNPSTTVTVLPEEGDTFVPGIYYFTILPGRFQRGFTVTVDLFDQNQADIVREVNDDVSIPRSSLSIGRVIGTEGSGKEDDPYLIKNKYDLEGLATIVADDQIGNETITYIRIENDIDLASMENWTPVNNSRNPEQIAKFDIDGNHKTISNFHPKNFARGTGLDNNTGHDQPSLFGIIYGSVHDLKIIDASLNLAGEASTVGILAGWVGFEGKEATVNNVHVQGSLKGKKCVGGMSGMARNATFEGCSANVEIEASDEHAACFVARCYENVSFTDCHAQGSVTGARTGVAGFLGFNEEKSSTPITINQCSAQVNVTGAYQVGGLVGYTQSEMHISDSWVKGDVTGRSTLRKSDKALLPGKQVGGILGVSANALVTITNCYYEGTITADGSYIGGIQGCSNKESGSETTITDCHAQCTINNTGAYYQSNGKKYDMLGVGGILGGSNGTAVAVSYCFVDGTISSMACGSMSAHPTDWADWVAKVKGETGGKKGGAVGGIIGYSAVVPTYVHHNISWVSSINITRDNIYDASSGPIVGSMSSEHNDLADATGVFNPNRYYRKSENPTEQEWLSLVTDTYDGYAMRTGIFGTTMNSVINVIVKNGAVPNYYALFCQPAKTTAEAVAKSNNDNWTFNTGLWGFADSKPYLKVRNAVYGNPEGFE